MKGYILKKQNLPFNFVTETAALNQTLYSCLNSGSDMMNAFIKMQSMDNSVPDPYGVEKFFIDFFVNEAMRDDFPLIANDFLSHEFTNICTYEKLDYFDIDAGDDWPEALFNRFIMRLIVNAVNSGSEYAKALILHLYKTYYKKEYKSLKRFSSISSEEILSLAKPETPSGFYLVNVSRLLYIVKLSGIQMRSDCSFLYAFLNDRAKELGEQPRFSFPIDPAELNDIRKEIEERFDIDKLYRLDSRISKYTENVLRWNGYNPDFIEWCDEDYRGIEDILVSTLALLRKTYPNQNKEYSAEELLIYSQIIHCVSAIVCNQEWMTEMLREVAYGIDGSGFYKEFPPLFKPSDVQVKGQKKQKKVVVKPAPVSEKSEEAESNEKILEELEILRRKIHKLESDNSSLRIDLSKKRKTEEENKELNAQMKCVKRELAALRSYVYGLTEQDEPVESESVEQMKREISTLRIIIIGGHTNWVSKLKKEFPNWEFVNPEAGGTTSVSIVNNADRVYFFTDTISHSRYYQFMNNIREHKVEFGYIHGVNIDKNIRNIYRDVIEER